MYKNVCMWGYLRRSDGSASPGPPFTISDNDDDAMYTNERDHGSKFHMSNLIRCVCVKIWKEQMLL